MVSAGCIIVKIQLRLRITSIHYEIRLHFHNSAARENLTDVAHESVVGATLRSAGHPFHTSGLSASPPNLTLLQSRARW